MNDNYDNYIEEYLFYDFQNMISDMVHRDFAEEIVIASAAKIEFMFNSLVSTFDYHHFPSKEIVQECTTASKDASRQIGHIVYKQNRHYANDVVFSYNNNFEIHMPLVKLYMFTKHTSNIKEVIKELGVVAEQYFLNKFDFDKCVCEITNKGAVLSNIGLKERSYEYRIKSPHPNLLVYPIYLPSSKIIVPMFIGSNSYRNYFYPFKETVPIFNSHYLRQKPDARVIITDSPEIADKNQYQLARDNVSSVVWISWPGERETIDKVDWDELHGRDVYYLIKKHSGFRIETICETALAVGSKLEHIAASVKYISYLNSSPYLHRVIGLGQRSPVVVPKVMVERMLDEEARFSIQPYQESQPVQLAAAAPVVNTGRGRMIFSPFIYERTITLIHGSPRSGKTFFAIGMAVYVSQYMRMFDGWTAKLQLPVLYLHAQKSEPSSLLERMQKYLPSVTRLGQISDGLRIEEIEEPKPIVDKNRIARPLNIFSHRFLPNLAQQIRMALTANNSQSSIVPAMVILDGFHALTNSSDQQERDIFLKALIEMGCAVVIIPPSGKMNQDRLHRLKSSLAADSVVRIEADEADGATMGLSLHIEKAFKVKETEPRCVRLKFHAELLDDRKWEIVRVKRPIEEEKKLVEKLLEKRTTAKAIAVELGISLPLAKKRILQVRRSNPDILPKPRRKKNKPTLIMR